MADFVIAYHGFAATLDVLTEPCLLWVQQNVAIEPWQWLGECRIGIDPREMEELHEALADAGFTDG